MAAIAKMAQAAADGLVLALGGLGLAAAPAAQGGRFSARLDLLTHFPPDGRLRSPVPFLPIDHVYAGSAWRTVSFGRGPLLGSDHYPLVAVLALEDRRTGPLAADSPPH